MTLRKLAALGALLCVVGAVSTSVSANVPAAAPKPVPVTILHTNDLHSHFRPEKTPMALGGVARLKTAIKEIRARTPHTFLVDGGDWSEGNIYYTEGAGRETLRMMDHLTYDVAVVGNHDWLNGPDQLLGIMEEANPAMSVVAANIKVSGFERAEEFKRRIPPYVIREIGGVKVAFIGLLTYEFIYDRFFKPVKITEPFTLARELARELKKKVDVVVAVSHNQIRTNKAILKAAPDIDLVVGAHDHVKLTKPVVVERSGGRKAWIVEAGSWGRYLGRVDLKITPRDPNVRDSKPVVELANYRLLQMDKTVEEDPETLGKLATLEALIEAKRGPVFHDHVGHTEIELNRAGVENTIGNFATDAYRAATGADLAIDHTNFIYGEIHRGDVTSADVYDSNPGVWNSKTEKAWTLSVIPIKGRALSWMLNLLYSTKAIAMRGGLNFSGVEMVFSPLTASSTAGGFLEDLVPPVRMFHAPFPQPDPEFMFGQLGIEPMDASASGLAIKSLKIGGKDLESDRMYRLAAPGGIVEALEFLNNLIPNAIPLDKKEDTGQEDWRVMADHLKSMSPVTFDKISYGNRVHTTTPDLGLLTDDIRWEPLSRDRSGRVTARIRVRVRNTGALPTLPGTREAGPRVALLLNQHGIDFSRDPEHEVVGAPLALPALAPGESVELSWNAIGIPETLGIYAIYARISGAESELNQTNNEVIRYFTLDASRSEQPHPMRSP